MTITAHTRVCRYDGCTSLLSEVAAARGSVYCLQHQRNMRNSYGNPKRGNPKRGNPKQAQDATPLVGAGRLPCSVCGEPVRNHRITDRCYARV